MSYVINNSRGQVVAVVPDGTINTAATPITLVGRGVTSYGEYENENYLWIMENFADSVAPPNPVLGQLWYNSATDTMAVWASGNSWSSLATQSFVTASVTAAKISPAFTGTPTAPTAGTGVSNTQIATTAFVAQAITNLDVTVGSIYAPIDSPLFTGNPRGPTPSTSDNSISFATTAFVQAQKESPIFTGVPVAPTASSATSNTQIATTAFVQAQKNSPALTGVPTAPTAVPGTNTTQIATTAFVNQVSSGLGTLSSQSASNVTITGGSITGISPLPVGSGGTGADNAADARNNLGLGSGATTSVGTMAVQNSNSVNITGGSITGISALAVASGGSGAATAAGARTNLGAAASATTITATGGLAGGGSLASNMTISIASGSNGYGNRYISASAPTGGSDGDIWYQI